MLEAMRVLSKVDGAALERYCFILARWRKEAEFIDKHGTTYPVRRDGEVLFKLFPAVKVFDLLTTQLGRLEQAFGLTPSARSRIITEGGLQPEETERDRLIRRKFIRVG
jgi:P27 family predicted phage terminase small subunit